jgi:hypothetical protein
MISVIVSCMTVGETVHSRQMPHRKQRRWSNLLDRRDEITQLHIECPTISGSFSVAASQESRENTRNPIDSSRHVVKPIEFLNRSAQ